MGKKVSSIYNTTFEVSLRVLIIIAKSEEPQSIEEISTIDFISVYGYEFGIGDYNLHGDNYYKYGEAAARYEKILVALRELSLRGLADIVPNKDGFQYRVTDYGREICETLDSSFALEFGRYAELAKEKVISFGLREIQNEIAKKAKQNIRRGTNA